MCLSRICTVAWFFNKISLNNTCPAQVILLKLKDCKSALISLKLRLICKFRYVYFSAVNFPSKALMRFSCSIVYRVSSSIF